MIPDFKSDFHFDVVTFARTTVVSGELKPLYAALSRMQWEEDQRARWAISYWCISHAGAASYLSQQPEPIFWHELRTAAVNTPGMSPVGGRWPRGDKRQNWRGLSAANTVERLSGRFRTAIGAVRFLTQPVRGGRGHDVENIMSRVQTLMGLSSWSSFSVSEMLDALGLVQLCFDPVTVFGFERPRAALKLWRRSTSAAPVNVTEGGYEDVYWLLRTLDDLRCPYRPDRGIRTQDVATILVHWATHLRGQSKTIDPSEVADELADWRGVSSTAIQLRQQLCGPKLK